MPEAAPSFTREEFRDGRQLMIAAAKMIANPELREPLVEFFANLSPSFFDRDCIEARRLIMKAGIVPPGLKLQPSEAQPETVS